MTPARRRADRGPARGTTPRRARQAATDPGDEPSDRYLRAAARAAAKPRAAPRPEPAHTAARLSASFLLERRSHSRQQLLAGKGLWKHAFDSEPARCLRRPRKTAPEVCRQHENRRSIHRLQGPEERLRSARGGYVGDHQAGSFVTCRRNGIAGFAEPAFEQFADQDILLEDENKALSIHVFPRGAIRSSHDPHTTRMQ